MNDSVSLESVESLCADDPETADRVLRIRALADFLESSIVETEYEAVAQIRSAVTPTPEGFELSKRLGNSTRNENYFALLVIMWWDNSLIDFQDCNIKELEAIINKQMIARALTFPYIYGRGLYDKMSEAIEDRRRLLPVDEALRLLEGIPQGVFQIYKYVSGPFGLLESRAVRYAPPERSVAAYHCEDLSCSHRHEVYLNTGNSRVSKLITKAYEHLRKQRDRGADWADFIYDQIDTQLDPYGWHQTNGLPALLGDAFGANELRLIIDDLRKHVKKISDVEDNCKSGTNALNEAELVQLILLYSDADILDAIDYLVIRKELYVPENEIRRSKIGTEHSRHASTILECTHLGIRFNRSRSDTILRVRHLIDVLFDVTDSNSRARLEWLIRTMEGDNLQEKLESFIRQADLASAIQTIAFDSQSNCDSAIEFLGIGPRTRDILSEDGLNSLMISKLNIESAPNPNSLNLIREHSSTMKNIVSKSQTYEKSDRILIGKAAHDYFYELEGHLKEFLKFTTWALLRDHFASSPSFAYSSSKAVEFTASTITAAGNFTLNGNGKWTLSPIFRSLTTLVTILESLESNSETLRPNSQIPKGLRSGSSYKFLFLHKYPFLDLTRESQENIIQVIRESARILKSGQVDEVRNVTIHPDRTFPAQDVLLAAIDSADNVLRTVEQAGLIPITSSMRRREIDRDNREVITLETPGRDNIQFMRPTACVLTGFPRLSEQQYIVPSAIFDGTNEVLRFGIREESEYSQRWENYPVRKVRTPNRKWQD